jgi:Putative beta-barrel porin-2, OmpL-like. bbp2
MEYLEGSGCMRMTFIGVLFGTTLLVQAGWAYAAQPDTAPSSTNPDLIGPGVGANDDRSLKDRLIDCFPSAIAQGLDIDAWGWAGDLLNNAPDNDSSNYYDLELGLGISQTFGESLKIAAQGNFIDADGDVRGELEQGYLTVKVWDAGQTLVTVGKFNANFGVEARDFWNRTTGTTSLLFGAQPQDLLGVMITQPIGDTGIELRPFVSNDFQGGYEFDQSASAGLTAQFKPNRQMEFAATGWVGPGFVPRGGRHIHSPYDDDAYGGDSYAAVVENWQGPNLTAGNAGTLYFGEGQVIVRPTSHLTLSAEFLQAGTSTRRGRWGWSGCMVMADYRVTDPLHVYARWSALDDSDWIITGIFQRCQEMSFGLGYEFIEGLEGRVEYRHDFSNAKPGFDSVSFHLTFSF